MRKVSDKCKKIFFTCVFVMSGLKHDGLFNCWVDSDHWGFRLVSAPVPRTRGI